MCTSLAVLAISRLRRADSRYTPVIFTRPTTLACISYECDPVIQRGVGKRREKEKLHRYSDAVSLRGVSALIARDLKVAALNKASLLFLSLTHTTPFLELRFFSGLFRAVAPHSFSLIAANHVALSLAYFFPTQLAPGSLRKYSSQSGGSSYTY